MAIGRDPNEQNLPIVFMLLRVEAETKDTWRWFLTLLFEDIGNPIVVPWVIMSYKKKVL